MTAIEFSDDQAAALKAKAQANGLTVQQWLWQLAAGQSKEAFAAEENRGDDNALLQHEAGEGHQGIPRKRRLIDVLMSSPFAGSELDIRRATDYPRSVDL